MGKGERGQNRKAELEGETYLPSKPRLSPSSPSLLSCLDLSWLSMEVELKLILFHFMPRKLALCCTKEYNVDLIVLGASVQMNTGYSIVDFSNLKVGVSCFHCCGMG